jgi:hypothetical protein
VDRDTVYRGVFEFARTFRDRLQNVPQQKSAIMAAEIGCDAFKLETALDKAIREFLEEAANSMDNFRLPEGK